MKALSLRQPWAHFVVHLGKGIENRRWNTTFRGEFLIHAAKGMTAAEYDDAAAMLADVSPGASPPAHATLARGGIVGVARLVTVVHPRSELLPIATQYPADIYASGGWRWHMPEQYGFVLADVRATPFVPLRGELNFFEVDDAVARAALASTEKGSTMPSKSTVETLPGFEGLCENDKGELRKFETRLRAPRSAAHTCHATGCTTHVPPEMWGCRKHWFMVPKAIRDRVWAAYRVGQCDDRKPSRAYCEAARDAVIAVAKREGIEPDTKLYDYFLAKDAEE